MLDPQMAILNGIHIQLMAIFHFPHPELSLSQNLETPLV